MKTVKTFAPRVLNENPESLHLYEAAMQQYHVLTAEQEREMVAKMLSGESYARETLILSNLRLAFKCAREWVSDRLPLEDLVSAAVEGLINGIDHFNPSKGERIANYVSFYIREKVQSHSEKNRSALAIPHRDCETSVKVRKIRVRVEQELGDFVDMQELLSMASEELGREEYELAEIMNAETPLQFEGSNDDDNAPLSLDATYGTCDSPETLFLTNELKESLYEGLGMLPERTARVLTLLFGLERDEPMKIKEVAALLSVCEETVSIERKRGLKMLNQYLNPRMAG